MSLTTHPWLVGFWNLSDDFFKGDLKLFVYPSKEANTGKITTVENLEVPEMLRKLYAYLADRGSFVDLDNYKPELLSIFPRNVLKSIADGNSDWEKMVPGETIAIIRNRELFGYKKEAK